MVARLPNVASDNDAWGSILNEYLLTGHRANGTHKLGWVVTEHGADNTGVEDSANVINSVIQGSAPGDAIVLPGGIYSIDTPIYLLPNRSYVGLGRPTLRQKSNTPLNFVVGADPGAATPVLGIRYSGIDIDGNRANNTTLPGAPSIFATTNFTAGITGWYNSGSAAVAHDAAVGRNALGALKLTASADGNPAATTTALSGQGIPIAQGATYTLSIWTRAGSTGRLATAAIQWYNGTTLLSTSTGTGATNNSGGWTESTATGTPPATATHCAVRVTFSSVLNTEIHYVDDLSLTLAFDKNHGLRLNNVAKSYFDAFNVRDCGYRGLYIDGVSYQVRMVNTVSDGHYDSSYFAGSSSYDNHMYNGVLGTSMRGAEISGARNTLNAMSVRDNSLAGVNVFSANCSVLGCSIEGNGRQGIYLGAYADLAMIKGNNIYGNSREAANTYEGILLDGTVGKTLTKVSILANQIASHTSIAAGQHLRAVTLGTYHQYAVVSGNNLDNNGALGIPSATPQVSGLAIDDIYNGKRLSNSAAMPVVAVDGEVVFVDDLDREEMWAAARTRWERLPTYKRDLQAGVQACTALAMSQAVVLPFDMGTTNYSVLVNPFWSTITYVSAQANSGFTITFSAAVPAGGRNMHWAVVRH